LIARINVCTSIQLHVYTPVRGSETTIEFKERYKKGNRVLEEIRLGSINIKKSPENKLPKGDLRGLTTKAFRVISSPIKLNPFLAFFYLSLKRPYLARQNFFK